MSRPSVPEGIRITKVGLWYVLFTVIVAIAGTNTGNNALYMVLAAMLGTLVYSGLVSRQNVRNLEVRIDEPEEVFANRPFRLPFRLRNCGRLMPRWCLLLTFSQQAAPLLVPYLERRGEIRGSSELILPRRGLQPLPPAYVSSLFPFGFFRKGQRYRTDIEVLVFPEVFPAGSDQAVDSGSFGNEGARRPGRGHDLHSLRAFRSGDDPRRIHWKQTARTGSLIFRESAADEARRLVILLDNGVAPFKNDLAEQRFERLVSEAATAAVDYLDRGFSVELVTRDRRLPFAPGRRQRFAVLEALALIEAVTPGRSMLASTDPQASELRLALADRQLTA